MLPTYQTQNIVGHEQTRYSNGKTYQVVNVNYKTEYTKQLSALKQSSVHDKIQTMVATIEHLTVPVDVH